MGRPRKNNAEYFTHDSGMRNDVKIKALRRRFSHTGYAVWNYILESLTDSADFRILWDDVAVDLYSADFDVTPETLTEIVSYCVKIDLLQINDNYLSSSTLYERFNSLVSRRGRAEAPQQVKQEFCGVSAAETPQNPTKTPQNSPECGENSAKCCKKHAETPQNPTKTPQKTSNAELLSGFSEFPSRGKESRVEKSKEEKSREYFSVPRTREANADEKKEIFEVFFFRNFSDPAREVERFAAWYAKEGRLPTRYDAELWNPENREKKFPDNFLKAWKGLYTVVRFSGPAGEKTADAMLDAGICIRVMNGRVILNCPEIVAGWLNGNRETAVEAMKPYLRGHPMDVKPYRRA